MTNFLEEALEQGEVEEIEEEVSFELDSAENWALGGRSFWKEQPPSPPKKAPEGESFDSLPLWTSPLNDQRRGAAAPLPLETSPSFSNERLFTPTAYSITPPGFGALDVLTERLQAPGSRSGLRARAEGQGQEQGQLVRSGELPLLSAVRRAERAASFVQGPRRNLTVTLPETLGGEAAGLTVESLDRAVERDARRYDGQSVFY